MTTLRMRARRLVVVCLVVASMGWSGASGVAGAQPAPAACPDDAPCLLSAGLPDVDVLNHQMSPDGRRAVFFFEENAGGDQQNELYSVPVHGGAAPVKLDTPDVTVIGRVLVSPDSTRVVYEARTDPTGPWRLFSVPIAGPASANRQIANSVAPSFGITGAPGGSTRISPSSRLVVYTGVNRDRLNVVPIDGPGTGARLTDRFVTGGQVGQFEISANSNNVVYQADQDSDAVVELFKVPLALTPAPDPPTTRLNGALPPGGEVDNFDLAPNNGRVVYLATQENALVRELFSVKLTGGARTKINAPLPSGYNVVRPNDTDPAHATGITLDGTQVVYETLFSESGPDGQEVDQRLYSVPIAGPGSTAVRLDNEAITHVDANEVTYQISGDSTRVVYSMFRQATSTQPDANWLLSVPLTGPASAAFSMGDTARALPHDPYSISPNGQRTVWKDISSSAHLYSTPTAGPAWRRQQLTGLGQNPQGPQVSPNSDRVLYYTSGPEADLQSTPTNGGFPRFNLTGSIHFDFIDGRFTLSSDGQSQTVVFAALEDFGTSGLRLYSSPVVPGG